MFKLQLFSHFGPLPPPYLNIGNRDLLGKHGSWRTALNAVLQNKSKASYSQMDFFKFLSATYFLSFIRFDSLSAAILPKLSNVVIVDAKCLDRYTALRKHKN